MTLWLALIALALPCGLLVGVTVADWLDRRP